MIIIYCHQDHRSAFSIYLAATQNAHIKSQTNSRRSRFPPSEAQLQNTMFTKRLICTCLLTNSLVVLLILMLSGDVHPNPGPLSTSRTSSISSVTSSVDSDIDLKHYFSFVHYNVQSLLPKLDILYTELNDFDILAFTETWINDDIPSTELLMNSFKVPERKDRQDRHGSVAVYIKENLFHRRRDDLEIIGVECIWIEITVSNRPLLFGAFYRPPNTTPQQHSALTDSIHLAFDTGIQDIIITGDFNLNANATTSVSKLKSICDQFSLTQVISENTHFTESSASLIDLILTSNPNIILSSGVADPFLSQTTRYHCPIYALLKLHKNRQRTYSRHVWLFDKGDFSKLRHDISNFDWDSLQNENIDIYAKNISDNIIKLSSQCIPNRDVLIRNNDPPWLDNNIRRYIRKRKRAYR